MDRIKVSLEELVDIETLHKVRESFRAESGIDVFVADVDDEREFNVEADIELQGRVAGKLRTKCLPEQEGRMKTILKNEAMVLSSIVNNNYRLRELNEEFEKSASLKADFLANMSHEIRTPMNAVIGMAEMALREDLPPAARDYIHQIKSAGRSLLAIINDILDFSKIESGKLDIIYSEYNIMTLVNDVSSIILTRLGDKDVELIVEVNPNFPKTLMGDDIRIKQILTNLAGNAVKFTNHGQVVLNLDFFKKNDSQIEVTGYIEDTGIGIKPENLEHLFESFQQVDSKRNRNIEGTGLGLAITKKLLDMMYGNILVESEYGVGSKFAFTFPQRVVSYEPSVNVPNVGNVRVAGLLINYYERKHIESEIVRLGATYFDLSSDQGLEVLVNEKINFLFVDKELYTEVVERFADEHPEITIAVIVKFSEHPETERENVVMVRKPLYAATFGSILRGEPVVVFDRNEDIFTTDFCAPEAKVLLVDDNEINLTVAEGLLEPFQMQVDTAISGMEALEKISEKHYDMIFMDHMMPEMDGVECTKIIRDKYPDYNFVPIVALTANVVEETRSMFLAEGMNDFLAKPVDMKLMAGVIKRWLPNELKHPIGKRKNKKPKNEMTEIPKIGDLDTENAIRLLGSEKLFWKVLKDYYTAIHKKVKVINKYYEEKQWKPYTIEVHALKSSSKQIGAMELSEMAAKLEKAGNELNFEVINELTQPALDKYQDYGRLLEQYFKEDQEDEGEKPMLAKELQLVYVQSLTMAAEGLDFDTIEATIAEIDKYNLEEGPKQCFAELKEAFDNIDFEQCSNILERWMKYI